LTKSKAVTNYDQSNRNEPSCAPSQLSCSLTNLLAYQHSNQCQHLP